MKRNDFVVQSSSYLLLLVGVFSVIAVFVLIKAREDREGKFSSSLEAAVPSVVPNVIYTDTLKREARITEIISRMQWLDSLRNDVPKLCAEVLDNFNTLEQEVDQSVRLFEATDERSEPWRISLYKNAARFLRYDCYSFFGSRFRSGAFSYMILE
jgi:hypothetical protein